MIVQHGPIDTLTGQLLRGTLEAAKLELGMSGSFLSHSYCDFPHLLTNCWIKVLWSECWNYRIKVHEQTPNLTLVCTADRNLMDSFVEAGYKAIELLRLNLCRLWSQAVLLADLVSGDGYHLLTGVFNGTSQKTLNVLE
jgi:hypothetical protein